MNTKNAIKNFGGYSHIIGGICVALAYTLHPHHQSAEIVSGQFWLIIHILFTLSLLTGIFGLFGLFNLHIRNIRWSGFIGFILAVTSLIGIFGLNYFETFINPVLALESPDFVNKYGAGTEIGLVAYVFPLSGLLFLFGYLFLCFDLLIANTLNRYIVVLTMVGTFVFGMGLSGMYPMIIVKVGSVLFGGGLLSMGVAVIMMESEEAFPD